MRKCIVAKAIEKGIVDIWHYGYTPDESEFYQPNHNGGLFRLGNLRHHAKNGESQYVTVR